MKKKIFKEKYEVSFILKPAGRSCWRLIDSWEVDRVPVLRRGERETR